MTGEDVKRMMEAGATLVQVYTGFVYNGVGFAGDLCKSLITPEATETTEPTLLFRHRSDSKKAGIA